MTLRAPAALLLAAAAALQLGYTLPAGARARAAGDAYTRARDARREAQAELAAAQRRQAMRALALQTASIPVASRDGAVADTRQTIVRALAGAGLRDVRLSVRSGAAPAVAVARVTGAGSFQDVMAFSARLLGPGSGLALEEARYNPGASGVSIDLTLVRVGSSQ